MHIIIAQQNNGSYMLINAANKWYLLLLHMFFLYISNTSLASPINITPIKDLPKKIYINKQNILASYDISTTPYQEITFPNQFPSGMTQVSKSGYCNINKHKMDKTGSCTM